MNASEQTFDTSDAASHRAGGTIQAESVGFDALAKAIKHVSYCDRDRFQ
jgi:hypothetical protein